MSGTSLDLSQIRTDALSSAATFRTLIGVDIASFATASQGTLADSALQPSDIASGTITPKTGNLNLNSIGGNSFSTIQPQIGGTSGTAVAADSSSDTLTLDTECGMVIGGDAASDKITLNAFGVVFPPHYSTDSAVRYGFSNSSTGVLAYTANRLYKRAILIPKRATITSVNLAVFTAVASSFARMGLRNMNQATGAATTLIADFGEVDTATNGSKSITGLSVQVNPGWYYLEIVASHAITASANTTGSNPFKLGYSSGTVNQAVDHIFRAFTYGALPSDETGVSQSRASDTTTPFFTIGF